MTVQVFRPDERTGILLHEATFLACAAADGLEPDLRLFRRNAALATKLSSLVYYPSAPDEAGLGPTSTGTESAVRAGFRVVEPPEAWSGSYTRADWSKRQLAETAVEMFQLSNGSDHLVLCSGDPAMTPLVRMVQRNGLRVSVVSSVRVRPRLIGDELRRQADHFVEFRDLAEFFLQPASSASRAPTGQ